MKGDFSRDTFKPEKHYSGVRMQQGRVLLDADWNEQVDITNYRMETAAADAVGFCGAPEARAGFKLEASTDQKTLLIGAGHFYVDGILCENETDKLAYKDQPVTPTEPQPTPPAKDDAYYLAYLDVWQHHLTVLDDANLHEVALEAPDTTTRTQTLWQVKLEKIALTEAGCDKVSEKWKTLTKRRTAPLAAKAADSNTASSDSCAVAPRGNFEGGANQLYRVEIHKAGKINEAAFKWSRDNGSIIGRINRLDLEENTITICEPPRDDQLAFLGNDWVEVISDLQEMRGEVGIVVRLKGQTQGITLIYDPETATGTLPEIDPTQSNAPKDFKVRKWHPAGAAMTVVSGGWQSLGQDGIEVNFGKDGALANSEEYKVGDYWLIPARTVTNNIDWPAEGNDPKFLEPFGVKHHYCRLAICKLDASGNWQVLQDCRRLFTSLADQLNMFYLGGDGQEAMPGEILPQPLRVGVPRNFVTETLDTKVKAKAKIRFTVIGGEGCLLKTRDATCLIKEEIEDDKTQISHEAQQKSTVDKEYLNFLDIEIRATGEPFGVAECYWRLDRHTLHQQVEARLIYNSDSSVVAHLPVHFNAGLSVASAIAVDCPPPRVGLPDEAPPRRTVANALAAAHSDRRQFVPLLAQTLPCLQQRDGRNLSFAIPSPTGLVFDGCYIYVGSAAKMSIFKIDPLKPELPLPEIPLPEKAGYAYYGAFDGKRLWFTSPYSAATQTDSHAAPHDQVFFIDLTTKNPMAKPLQVGLFPAGIAFDGEYIWVANFLSKTVSIIQASNQTVLRTITLRGEDGQPVAPTNLAFDGSYMWIGGALGSLFRVKKAEDEVWTDPELVEEQLEIFPRELAFDGSHMWITSCREESGPVYKINVQSLVVTKLNDYLSDSHGVVFDGRHVWLLATSQVNSHLQDVHFIDLNRGWAVGNDSAILFTKDGGKKWQRQNVPAGLTAHFNAVFFINEQNGWIVGNDATILNTTDGGATWTTPKTSAKDATAHLHGVHFVDGKFGWAVGNKGTILVTADGGQTWNKQTITGLTANLHGVHFLNASRGWVVGSNATILSTTDGGKTWNPPRTMPSGITAHLRDVYFVDQNHGCAVGNNGTILITTDGGAEWISKKAIEDTPDGEKKEINAHLNAVQFVNALTGWAVGNDATILRTNNSGNDWAPQELPQGVTAHLRGGYFFGDPNDNQSASGRVVGNDATILTYDFLIPSSGWLEQSPPGSGAGLMHKVDASTNSDAGSIALDRAPLSDAFDGTHLWLSLENHRVQKWLVG